MASTAVVQEVGSLRG